MSWVSMRWCHSVLSMRLFTLCACSPGVLFLARLRTDRLVPLRTCILHVPPCSPSRVLSLDACEVHCVCVTGHWSVVFRARASICRGWCVSCRADASVTRQLLVTCPFEAVTHPPAVLTCRL